MILLIILIAIFIISLGLVAYNWFKHYDDIGDAPVPFIISAMSGIILLIMSFYLFSKPIELANYEVAKENIEYMIENDIKDIMLTKTILELNSSIDSHKRMSKNIWIGVFYNKKIGELEKIEIK